MTMDVTRRDFVKSAGVAGVGSMMLGGRLFAQAAPTAASTEANSAIRVGLIGAGVQGRVLAECIRKIPGLRFQAICDIWDYNRNYTARRLKAYKQPVNAYEDYRDMLDKESGLDAVVVATPDWVHAEHSIAALQAGKHVYCEKEMAHELSAAAAMCKAAAASGKVMQIGHQRRSNPIYQQAYKMIHEENLCGRLTQLYGQWNRTPEEKLTWPEKQPMTPEMLAKYGYANMDEFKNWRWYRRYSAGPIGDLGSHQIDIFSWFLNAEPSRLMAMGGHDYFEDREWHEDVVTLYEYQTLFAGKKGSARAYYQVLNTSGWQEYYERFNGDRGSINLSENTRKCYYIPGSNVDVPDWMRAVERIQVDGLSAVPLVPALKAKSPEMAAIMDDFDAKQGHHLHLENFFQAVAKNDPKAVNCPPAVGYATTVAVLNVVPAIERGGGVSFQASDFVVQ
jgi:predicted dehydrogenase